MRAPTIKAAEDVNAKNNDGRTALSFALMENEPEIASLLLNSGAGVSKNDLELAQRNEKLKGTYVIEELKSKLM
jgi:ankyrin repeat protein